MDPMLKKLGWNAFFGESFREYAVDHEPGRVAAVSKSGCQVHTKEGVVRARVSGRLRQDGLRPAVGDWVAIFRDDSGTRTLQAILPRRSKISRKDPGRAVGEQVMATNIDTVFVVTSLNQDLNLRRLERYLAVAKQSGAVLVVVLNKSDLCADVEAKIDDVKSIASDVPVLAISAAEKTGLEKLSPYLQDGKTVVLLGSSGVGKSTIINALEGRERQKIGEIREDDGRGRHTTTARELLILEKGGIIIDNPGMREIQLWDAGEGLEEAFQDVIELARECKFRDCRHETEPGCAVKRAIEEGTLSEVRLESYRKLQRELLAIERKKNPKLMAEEQKKWKNISRMAKEIQKRKAGDI
ncbi:MAG TPA: ribosome small subunit-dependent GTPase A [Methanothrix sp.]|nr:ribosome small subunit-dependent GTPase A [Methanothrix sp.]HPR67315.1 ribosome small subunit-dependent GTPase A [Methanothrix sp.]